MTRKKLIPIEKAKIVYAGASTDGRANRWKFYCLCGRSFEPPTTRLAKNSVDCEACGRSYLVNYNTEEISNVKH